MDWCVLCAHAQHMTRLLIFNLYSILNATVTTEIYTLSLHDALPISGRAGGPGPGTPGPGRAAGPAGRTGTPAGPAARDRKSTRLKSSHRPISYAVFCLKKKKKQTHNDRKKLAAHITALRDQRDKA